MKKREVLAKQAYKSVWGQKQKGGQQEANPKTDWSSLQQFRTRAAAQRKTVEKTHHKRKNERCLDGKGADLNNFSPNMLEAGGSEGMAREFKVGVAGEARTLKKERGKCLEHALCRREQKEKKKTGKTKQ